MQKTEQFTLRTILILHLAPGLVILLTVLLFASPLIGLPMLTSVLLAIPVALLPTQWGIMAAYAKCRKLTIREAIPFLHEDTSKGFNKKALVWCFLAFCFLGATTALQGAEAAFWQPMFRWLPGWFSFDRIGDQALSGRVAAATVALNFVFNVFLAPITEEVYFRGFLLPRMERFGAFAPVVGVALFSVYHFFNPFQLLWRLCFIPAVYVTWKYRDIRYSAIPHVLGNMIGAIGLAALYWPG
ncbi:MAG: CPBP family intramembrane metalloprotease [Lachnospiraceae bacterium]|jgi:membrane protease YdiL (CAAX protease family)|nr:CPBP family intramembrane metalloprotease [Lachnospiraceae bacterium]